MPAVKPLLPVVTVPPLTRYWSNRPEATTESLPYMSRRMPCPRIAESGLFVSLMSCARA